MRQGAAGPRGRERCQRGDEAREQLLGLACAGQAGSGAEIVVRLSLQRSGEVTPRTEPGGRVPRERRMRRLVVGDATHGLAHGVACGGAEGRKLAGETLEGNDARGLEVADSAKKAARLPGASSRGPLASPSGRRPLMQVGGRSTA